MLKPWMDQFSSILNLPVQPEDPDDWSIRMEVMFNSFMYVIFSWTMILTLCLHQVLKCLNQFVQNFPGLVESQFMGKIVA